MEENFDIIIWLATAQNFLDLFVKVYNHWGPNDYHNSFKSNMMSAQ